MAGHSQWNNIKFRKLRQDAQKTKVFSRFSKDIFFYAKQDSDPKTNPSLRNCISQARLNKVPNSIIEKAIKKAIQKENYGFETNYECLRGNVAFIVNAVTNNKTRTAAEIREVLKDHNAMISNCNYMFEKMYLIKVKGDIDDEAIFLCERFENIDQDSYLFINPKNASKAYSLLKDILLSSKFIFVPLTTVENTLDSDRLLDDLESLDDIYEVFCNTYSFRI